jgi:hypothetical protein
MVRQSRTLANARRAIAAQAARLIAADGIVDYGAAKRKAARQLGFRDTDGLPDNAEIEAELRAYQSLFQNQEQRSRLAELRRIALTVMRDLEPYRPLLAGSVWNGTAPRGAAIEIDVFTDEGKLLELSLINRGIAFTTLERPHFSRTVTVRVPVLKFAVEDVEVALAVYNRADLRQAMNAGIGAHAVRGNTAELAALVSADVDQDDMDRFLAAIR